MFAAPPAALAVDGRRLMGCDRAGDCDGAGETAGDGARDDAEDEGGAGYQGRDTWYVILSGIYC